MFCIYLKYCIDNILHFIRQSAYSWNVICKMSNVRCQMTNCQKSKCEMSKCRITKCQMSKCQISKCQMSTCLDKKRILDKPVCCLVKWWYVAFMSSVHTDFVHFLFWCCISIWLIFWWCCNDSYTNYL